MKREVECCKEEFSSRPAFSKYMHKHLYSTPSGESQTNAQRTTQSRTFLHARIHVHWFSTRRNRGTLVYSITFLSVYMYRNDYLQPGTTAV